MFIHIVHAFPIDFEQIFKNILLYESHLTIECFHFAIFSSL